MYYILYVPSGNCCRAWCVGGTWVTIYLKALAYGPPKHPKAPCGALRRLRRLRRQFFLFIYRPHHGKSAP